MTLRGIGTAAALAVAAVALQIQAQNFGMMMMKNQSPRCSAGFQPWCSCLARRSGAGGERASEYRRHHHRPAVAANHRAC